MPTYHKLILGNSMSMEEIPDKSVHLIVTSPPYFNAPFDYKGLFESYEKYLTVLQNEMDLRISANATSCGVVTIMPNASGMV